MSGGAPSPPLMIEGPRRPPSAPVGRRIDPYGEFGLKRYHRPPPVIIDASLKKFPPFLPFLYFFPSSMSSTSCFFTRSFFFLPEFSFRFPLVCRVPHLPSASLPTFLLSASPPLPLLCHQERVSINPGGSSWSSCECLLGGLEGNSIKFQSSSPLPSKSPRVFCFSQSPPVLCGRVQPLCA